MFEQLIPGVGPAIEKLLNLIPDPKARAEAAAQAEKDLLQAFQQEDANQADIDKVEASSTRLWIAGWRPFIGWVCGSAFAYTYVLQPFLAFMFAACGHPVSFPTLDFNAMSSVLLGMLGLGGMRTFEKIKGVA